MQSPNLKDEVQINHGQNGSTLLISIIFLAVVLGIALNLSSTNVQMLHSYENTEMRHKRNLLRSVFSNNINCLKTFEVAGIGNCAEVTDDPSNPFYLQPYRKNRSEIDVAFYEIDPSTGNKKGSGAYGDWHVRAKCWKGAVVFDAAKFNPGTENFAKSLRGNDTYNWSHPINPVISDEDGLCTIGGSGSTPTTEVLTGTVNFTYVPKSGPGWVYFLAEGAAIFEKAQLGASEFFSQEDPNIQSVVGSGGRVGPFYINSFTFNPGGNFININSIMDYSFSSDSSQENVTIYTTLEVLENGTSIWTKQVLPSGIHQNYSSSVKQVGFLPVTPGSTITIRLNVEVGVYGNNTGTWSGPITFGPSRIMVESFETNLN